jgi:hypothetical protein
MRTTVGAMTKRDPGSVAFHSMAPRLIRLLHPQYRGLFAREVFGEALCDVVNGIHQAAVHVASAESR